MKKKDIKMKEKKIKKKTFSHKHTHIMYIENTKGYADKLLELKVNV